MHERAIISVNLLKVMLSVHQWCSSVETAMLVRIAGYTRKEGNMEVQNVTDSIKQPWPCVKYKSAETVF